MHPLKRLPRKCFSRKSQLFAANLKICKIFYFETIVDIKVFLQKIRAFSHQRIHLKKRGGLNNSYIIVLKQVL